MTRVASKRWFPRFSLAAMLGVLVILCLSLGARVQKANQQRLVAKLVLRHDGRVQYDWEPTRTAVKRGAGAPLNAVCPGPKWCRDFLGDEYFQDIVYIGIWKSNLTESEIHEISKISSLEQLYVSGISDVELESISRISSLTNLGLGNSPVTDQGMVTLRRLKRLRNLDLSLTRVTEPAATALQRELPDCEIVLVAERDKLWAEERIKGHDGDEDSRLNPVEWERLQRAGYLPINFDSMDTDQNGHITILELARWATRSNWRNKPVLLAAVTLMARSLPTRM